MAYHYIRGKKKKMPRNSKDIKQLEVLTHYCLEHELVPVSTQAGYAHSL